MRGVFLGKVCSIMADRPQRCSSRSTTTFREDKLHTPSSYALFFLFDLIISATNRGFVLTTSFAKIELNEQLFALLEMQHRENLVTLHPSPPAVILFSPSPCLVLITINPKLQTNHSPTSWRDK